MPEPQGPSPTNPILEANPAALDELFSRDPLDLSDRDLETMVSELRRMRETWDSGKPAAKTGPKAPKAPKPPVPTLADLGLLPKK